MEEHSWQVLRSEFQKLRESDQGRLEAVFQSIDGITYQWVLSGSDDAVCADFMELARRGAQKAGAGTSWQDWLELLRQQEGAFSPAPSERFQASPEERAKEMRQSIARALYGKLEAQALYEKKLKASPLYKEKLKASGKKLKAEDPSSMAEEIRRQKRVWAEAVRQHMATVTEIPPVGSICRVCQKSAIYCGGREDSAMPDTRHRLELHEGRKQLRIDKDWRDYTGERASYLLAMLMKAKGEWEPGPNLVSDNRSRADRIIKHLPEPIRKIIDSQTGGTGGYRIKPEYFRLT